MSLLQKRISWSSHHHLQLIIPLCLNAILRTCESFRYYIILYYITYCLFSHPRYHHTIPSSSTRVGTCQEASRATVNGNLRPRPHITICTTCYMVDKGRDWIIGTRKLCKYAQGNENENEIQTLIFVLIRIQDGVKAFPLGTTLISDIWGLYFSLSQFNLIY